MKRGSSQGHCIRTESRATGAAAAAAARADAWKRAPDLPKEGQDFFRANRKAIANRSLGLLRTKRSKESSFPQKLIWTDRWIDLSVLLISYYSS
jgi:hypothetical protein